jgi:uncharacterized membrane protein (UPF0127 family)
MAWVSRTIASRSASIAGRARYPVGLSIGLLYSRRPARLAVAVRDDGRVWRRGLAPVALILAIACSTTAGGPPACNPPPPTVTFGQDATLQVDIASDDAARARGLMGVTDLAANRGMAFVWGAPTDGSFWMKDTLIPLSIAFIDEAGRVITIDEMTPCTADPCDTYEPSGPYVLAVEANAGWFAEHGIEVGDRADLHQAACL